MPQTKLLLTLLTSLTISAELALPPLAAAQTISLNDGARDGEGRRLLSGLCSGKRR